MTEAGEPARRATWKVEAAVAVGLGLAVFGAWWFFLRPPKRFNVVLVSIDSLRADHVGCYGYAKPTTPAIDALAARGARFATAHSTTSWTLPAHMALMTGLTNDLHDVVVDVSPLDPNRKLLAEVLQRAGYDTGGVYGGIYLDKFFGFDRGFRTYVNCGVALAPGREAHVERDSHRVVTAPRTTQEAERFLAARDADKPFFLFVHHWDAHYDYIAPKDYVARFAGDYRGTLDVANFYFNDAIHAGMSAEDLAYVKACYDAEIRFVDDHLARLFARLDEMGVLDETYVIVTSDHGEEFFEHGQKGHRLNLHEETLRIPLVVAGPGIAPRVIENGVRICDVMPTVLELCGLPPEPDCAGASLAPLLRGEDPDELRDLPIVAELTHLPKEKDDSGTWGVAPRYEKHSASSHERWKYMEIRTRAYDYARAPLDFSGDEVLPAKSALYDLRADPAETTDLATVQAEVLAWMRDRHADIGAAFRRARDALRRIDNPTPRVLDQGLDRMLNEMGYLGSGKRPPPPRPRLAPADKTASGSDGDGEDARSK